MTTLLDIANLSLDRIGDKPIADLNDPNPRAAVLNRNITQGLSECIRQYDWNCHTQIMELSPVLDNLGDPVMIKDKHIYGLPDDFIRLVDQNSTDKYKIIHYNGNRVLSTMATTPCIQYLFFNTAPDTWDSLFTEFFILDLALKISFKLTKSTTLINQLERERDRVFEDARVMDAKEGSSDPISPYMWQYD